MNDWKEMKLDDICTIVMGQSPKSLYYNQIGEGLPFLQGNRTFGIKFPTIDTFTNKITKIAGKNDIIMSVRAPVGDINIAPTKLCLGRGLCGFRANNNNQEFLYYLLKHNVDKLKQRESGTVFGSVNKKDIQSLSVNYPIILSTQKKIALILSALDDKIELNNKINQNLEKMAQVIFKSWFVDFEPWGGVIPEDWKNGKLGDICNITSGKRPKLKTTNKTIETNIPILGASSIMGYTNSTLYNEKLLITGRVGTHGIIQRVAESCWPSDNTLVIKSNFYEYIYQQLGLVNFSNLNRGSTQPLITQTDLKNISIIIPNKNIILKFENLIDTIMEKNKKNKIESKKIVEIRETLLPKLLSGQLDVSNINFDD